MLLTDVILQRTPKKSCTTVLYTNNHSLFFRGHYPGDPIFPGALLIEAMSQAMIASYCDFSEIETINPRFLLAEIISAKFFKTVTPGMVLLIRSETISHKHGIYHANITIHLKNSIDIIACSSQKVAIPSDFILPKVPPKL